VLGIDVRIIETMLRSELEPCLDAALEALRDRDNYLLSIGTNERSITHRLACYLQETLSDWNVDCEYNRDGRWPKKVVLPIDQVSTAELRARTVYPDIIVHLRGPNGPNILAIELKVEANEAEKAWDITKLCAYRDEFAYDNGVFINVRLDDSGRISFEKSWPFARVDA
jgi:hypothetical protein